MVSAEKVSATEIKGTVDLAKSAPGIASAAELAKLGDEAKNVPFTATLDAEGRISKIVISMPTVGDYPAADMTTTFTDYGTSVDGAHAGRRPDRPGPGHGLPVPPVDSQADDAPPGTAWSRAAHVRRRSAPGGRAGGPGGVEAGAGAVEPALADVGQLLAPLPQGQRLLQGAAAGLQPLDDPGQLGPSLLVGELGLLMPVLASLRAGMRHECTEPGSTARRSSLMPLRHRGQP